MGAHSGYFCEYIGRQCLDLCGFSLCLATLVAVFAGVCHLLVHSADSIQNRHTYASFAWSLFGNSLAPGIWIGWLGIVGR